MYNLLNTIYFPLSTLPNFRDYSRAEKAVEDGQSSSATVCRLETDNQLLTKLILSVTDTPRIDLLSTKADQEFHTPDLRDPLMVLMSSEFKKLNARLDTLSEARNQLSQ